MVYLLKYIQDSPHNKAIRFSGSSFDLHVFSNWIGLVAGSLNDHLRDT